MVAITVAALPCWDVCRLRSMLRIVKDERPRRKGSKIGRHFWQFQYVQEKLFWDVMTHFHRCSLELNGYIITSKHGELLMMYLILVPIKQGQDVVDEKITKVRLTLPESQHRSCLNCAVSPSESQACAGPLYLILRVCLHGKIDWHS